MKHIWIMIGLAALVLLIAFTSHSVPYRDLGAQAEVSASMTTPTTSDKSVRSAKATAEAPKGNASSEAGAVVFADFSVRVKPKEDEVNVKGSFTLGAGSNGINLFTETTTIKVGAFSATIPAGKFKSGNNGKVEFKRLIDCKYWDLFIRPSGKDAFEFNLELLGTQGTANLKADEITVSIGDDSGTAKGVQ